MLLRTEDRKPPRRKREDPWAMLTKHFVIISHSQLTFSRGRTLEVHSTRIICLTDYVEKIEGEKSLIANVHTWVEGSNTICSQI